jgi:hypothetical protein
LPVPCNTLPPRYPLLLESRKAGMEEWRNGGTAAAGYFNI